MLKTINEKLLKVNNKVFYGTVNPEEINDYNYIVYRRKNIAGLNDKLRKATYFEVYVVAEAYIDDDVAEKVLTSMKEIPGLKLADADPEYAYERNPNTGETIEILKMTFVKAESRIK